MIIQQVCIWLFGLQYKSAENSFICLAKRSKATTNIVTTPQMSSHAFACKMITNMVYSGNCMLIMH